MDTLKELFGDSYQTKLWGLVMIGTGALSLVLGKVFDIGEISASAIPLFLGGIASMLARSEKASSQARAELSQGIASLEQKHDLNAKKIEVVTDAVQKEGVPVPHVVEGPVAPIAKV